MRFLTAAILLLELLGVAVSAEPQFRVRPAATFTITPAVAPSDCPCGSACACAPGVCPSCAASNPSQATVYISRSLGNGTSDAGTGTVIASEGGKSLILTNAHVVESGTGSITVTHGTSAYPATYVGGSSVNHIGPNTIQVNGPDLALLAVDAALPAVPIASEPPAVGARLRLWGFGGRLAAEGAVAKSGYVVQGPNFVTPTLSSTLATISGDSGSGYINDAGELVGVHHGRDNQAAYGVPVTVVRVFVREKSVRLFPRLAERLAMRRAAKEAVKAAVEAVPASAPRPPEFVIRSAPAVVVPPTVYYTPAPTYYIPSCPGGTCPAPTYSYSRGGLFRR